MKIKKLLFYKMELFSKTTFAAFFPPTRRDFSQHTNEVQFRLGSQTERTFLGQQLKYF
jgi:hypothetical protein